MKLKLVGRASYRIVGHPVLDVQVECGQSFELEDEDAKALIHSCPGLFEIVDAEHRARIAERETLMRAIANTGQRVAGMKPVASGCRRGAVVGPARRADHPRPQPQPDRPSRALLQPPAG